MPRKGFVDFKTVGHCCKDCAERHPACHDTCEKYIKAKAEWTEIQEKIKHERNLTWSFDTYHFDQVVKRQIKRGKR